MDLVSINNSLSRYTHLIALLAVVATLFASVVALYLGSPYLELKKIKRIKTKKNAKRLGIVYNDMLAEYERFSMENRESKFEDHIKWNKVPIKYRNYSTSLKEHQEELEFFDYLKDNKVATYGFSISEALNPISFHHYEYTIFPTNKSWGHVITIHNQTPHKKRFDKLSKVVENDIRAYLSERRKFLSIFLPLK